jgi:hypothetical protein
MESEYYDPYVGTEWEGMGYSGSDGVYIRYKIDTNYLSI